MSTKIDRLVGKMYIVSPACNVHKDDETCNEWLEE